ncbi:MAG: hypothetical protein ACR2PL_15255 [Dehalococcoidia bacterium]
MRRQLGLLLVFLLVGTAMHHARSVSASTQAPRGTAVATAGNDIALPVLAAGQASPTPTPSATPSPSPSASPSPSPCVVGNLANFPAELNSVYMDSACHPRVQAYTLNANDPKVVNSVLTIPSGNTQMAANVTIPSGLQLAIQPGALVKVAANAKLSVLSGGVLNSGGPAGATGLASLISSKPIPVPGDWGGVVFEQGSSGTLDHLQISDAGQSIKYGGCNCPASAGLVIAGGAVTLTNSSIDHSLGNGVEVASFLVSPGSLSLTGDNFTNNAEWAVIFDGTPNSFSTGTGLSGSGNGHDRIGLQGGRFTGVWNLAASPNLPLQLTGDLHVGPGGSLNMGPGSSLAMSGNSIFLDIPNNCCVDPKGPGGVFNASGTVDPGGAVTLTSANASPAPGDWGGVVFQEGSSGTLDHVQISDAGQAIKYNGCNCPASAGRVVAGGAVTLTNSSIDHSAGNDVEVASFGVNLSAGPTILHNDRFGAVLGPAGTFSAVTNDGWHSGQPQVDATEDDWGSASGPSGSTAFGSGVAVSPGVYFDPWIDQAGATLSGTVLDASVTSPRAVPNAAVEVCNGTLHACRTVIANGSGQYSLGGLGPDKYTALARPPSTSNLSFVIASITIGEAVQNATQDLTLSAVKPPRPGSFGGLNLLRTTAGGVPVFRTGQPFIICYPTCPPGLNTSQARSNQQGAVPQLDITQSACGSGNVALSLFDKNGKPIPGPDPDGRWPMTETPKGSGHYVLNVPSSVPAGHITWLPTVHCPGGSSFTGSEGSGDQGQAFLDPSGTVETTGRLPVIGATVTLMRSDYPSGPFTPVAAGSALISQSNPKNPDVTNNDGIFHWDVLAGFYKVVASKTGCNDANGHPITASTDVLQVPPPRFDLVITLDCPTDTPGPSITEALPIFGPSRGGTGVTIFSKNIQSGATVTIGGRPATVLSVSTDGSSIMAMSPAHGLIGDVNSDNAVTPVDALCVLRDVAHLPATAACPTAGLSTLVDVTVTNPDGRSVTLNASYIYDNEDVNADGADNAVDALCILRSVAGLAATAVCPAIPIPQGVGTSPPPSTTPLSATPSPTTSAERLGSGGGFMDHA